MRPRSLPTQEFISNVSICTNQKARACTADSRPVFDGLSITSNVPKCRFSRRPFLGSFGRVVDFGGLKELRAILEGTFDHKTVVAADDPELAWFPEAARRGLADIVVLPAVGSEKFAEHVYRVGSNWLLEKGLAPRCRLVSVEVKEHGANSAIYREAGCAADQRNI